MSEFNCKVINAKIEMFSIALANSDIDSPKIYIEDNEIAFSWFVHQMKEIYHKLKSR